MLKHCSNDILVYKSNYTTNVLPLSIPLIVHMLYANETLEEVMESISKVQLYALLYLAHCI